MKLSTGMDSNLGSYEHLTKVFFGEDSEPHKFIQKKISESKNGRDEKVIAPEEQMLQLFGSML